MGPLPDAASPRQALLPIARCTFDSVLGSPGAASRRNDPHCESARPTLHMLPYMQPCVHVRAEPSWQILLLTACNMLLIACAGKALMLHTIIYYLLLASYYIRGQSPHGTYSPIGVTAAANWILIVTGLRAWLYQGGGVQLR